MRPLESFNFSSTRPQNSSLFQEHAGQTIGVALIGLLHNVGVNIGGGADLSVAQPLRRSHFILSYDAFFMALFATKITAASSSSVTGVAAMAIGLSVKKPIRPAIRYPTAQTAAQVKA